MDLKTITKKYAQKKKAHDQEKERIESEIGELNQKLDEMNRSFPTWIEGIIHPIAEQLLKMMEDADERYFKILGPFGLNAEVSIHFYEKQYEDEDPLKMSSCIGISFRPGNLDEGEIFVVDYSEYIQRFPVGSIGELNGGNYSTLPLPDTMEELYNLMMQQEAL